MFFDFFLADFAKTRNFNNIFACFTDQSQKLVCNNSITEEMSLKPMSTNAWTWYAMD